jgi:hypothetical protein
MCTTLLYVRRVLVAVLAMLVTSMATSWAGSCSMFESSGRGARAESSGRGSPWAAESPTSRAEIAGSAVVTFAFVVRKPSLHEDCPGRFHEPAICTTRPQTESDYGTDPGRDSYLVQLGDDHTARLRLALRIRETQSKPTAPLYLRNERLLF